MTMATLDFAAEVRRLLVADALRLVAGIVSLTLGVASILVQWLRRKTQDRFTTLVWAAGSALWVPRSAHDRISPILPVRPHD